VSIRTVSTAEADEVADLWVELARDQRRHGSHLLGASNRTAIHEVIVQRIVTDDLLVAERDGAIVGFVMYTMEGGRYEQDVTTGLVENLYVKPEARRDGIGSALLDEAEDRLRDNGATAITIEAMADNDAAREFYTAHGYAPHRVELEKSMENDTS
jgi:ribosomal protein S18 acetylase RimI-like enzyme